jgi:Flp pilus assembly protein TadB
VTGLEPLVAAFLAAAAVVVGLPVRPAVSVACSPPDGPVPDKSWLRRHRVPLSLSAAVAGPTLLPLAWGLAGGVGLAVAVWWAAGRAEPPGVRRDREAVARELPGVVRLLAVALAAGVPVPLALEQVADALPGRTTELLRLCRGRLALGVPAEQVWAELARQPGMEPLGRALARAHRSGGGVAETAVRVADELAREARLAVEDRARAVGIRAAVPLGACLLPAFLLVGIVPVVVAAAQGLGW